MGVDLSGPRERPPADGSGRRIGIVGARWNDQIVSRLLHGAREHLRTAGVADGDVELHWVPGAFEVPLGVRALADTGRVDGVIALGCVIRGETAHFEYVAGPAAEAVMRVQLDTGVPVGFGILTVEDRRQALVRSVVDGDVVGDNKGAESAATVLEMLRTLDEIRG